MSQIIATYQTCNRMNYESDSSITSTCRRHEIDPQRYLTQLLTNLPDTRSSQLDQWLPDQWKKLNGEPMPGAQV